MSAVFATVALLLAALLNRDPYMGAIAVEATTGRVLFEDSADTVAYPASVTKLMTAFVVLDEVKSGKIALTDQVAASPVKNKTDKWLRQPSCTGLQTGQKMTVDELLKALMVNSANDSAIFLAEHTAGSVGDFVRRMNAKAASLGMKSTVYFNPNGLPPPPGAKEQNFNRSTARDQAKLAQALLRKHPEIIGYTSIKVWEVTTCGEPFLDLKSKQQIRWVNHNNVMVKDRLKIVNPDGKEAVDGMKTGYIRAGGYSVVLTGTRRGKRAIVVVLGSAMFQGRHPSQIRDENASRIMQDALSALSW